MADADGPEKNVVLNTLYVSEAVPGGARDTTVSDQSSRGIIE